jgi:hypothetical protein
MKDILLVTFGCSWTAGVSSGYQPGMSKQHLEEIAWEDSINQANSFRGLLCNTYHMHNVNFALGGSSNQTQFRLAEKYFSSSEFQQAQSQYKKIIVLWGITSTQRNELYFAKLGKIKSFMYANGSDISKLMVDQHYSHDAEVGLLFDKIGFWNYFFKQNNVDNIWFDTFNHHDYDQSLLSNKDTQEYYEAVAGVNWPTWQQAVRQDLVCSQDIVDEILDLTRWDFKLVDHYAAKKNFFLYNSNPRDLCSQLALSQGIDYIDSNYHVSFWQQDSNRIDFLASKQIVNPISYHPTRQGHQLISTIFEPMIENILKS